MYRAILHQVYPEQRTESNRLCHNPFHLLATFDSLTQPVMGEAVPQPWEARARTHPGSCRSRSLFTPCTAVEQSLGSQDNKETCLPVALRRWVAAFPGIVVRFIILPSPILDELQWLRVARWNMSLECRGSSQNAFNDWVRDILV